MKPSEMIVRAQNKVTCVARACCIPIEQLIVQEFVFAHCVCFTKKKKFPE